MGNLLVIGDWRPENIEKNKTLQAEAAGLNKGTVKPDVKVESGAAVPEGTVAEGTTEGTVPEGTEGTVAEGAVPEGNTWATMGLGEVRDKS